MIRFNPVSKQKVLEMQVSEKVLGSIPSNRQTGRQRQTDAQRERGSKTFENWKTGRLGDACSKVGTIGSHSGLSFNT